MPLTTYTAGEVLTAASLNSNFNYAAGDGGLVCVKAQTAVSGVTSVNVDNVFTSDFTNYLINLNMLAASGTGFTIALRAGGTTTSTNYASQSLTINGTSVSGGRTTGDTSFYLPNLRTNPNGMTVQLFSPQLAQFTSMAVNGIDIASTTTFYSVGYWGLQITSTQFDGFNITAGANMTGSYSVYAYSKTVRP